MPKATLKTITEHIAKPQKPGAQRPEDCPVVSLMTKMIGLYDAHKELEADFASSRPEVLREAMNDLWAARTAYAEIVSVTRARSLEGALLQVALVVDAVSEMPEMVDDTGERATLERYERKITQLCYSIASVIRTIVGDTLADHAAKPYLPPSGDPLAKFDAALAGKPIGSLFRSEWRRAAKVQS